MYWFVRNDDHFRKWQEILKPSICVYLMDSIPSVLGVFSSREKESVLLTMTTYLSVNRFDCVLFYPLWWSYFTDELRCCFRLFTNFKIVEHFRRVIFFCRLLI